MVVVCLGWVWVDLWFLVGRLNWGLVALVVCGLFPGLGVVAVCSNFGGVTCRFGGLDTLVWWLWC